MAQRRRLLVVNVFRRGGDTGFISCEWFLSV